MTLKLRGIAFAVLIIGINGAFAAPAPATSDGNGYAEVEWIRTPRPTPHQTAKPDVTTLAAMKDEAAADWTVELADQTFHQTLLRWCRLAGWQLVWEAERDFAIDAQVTLQGNFFHAVEQSMRSLRETDFPLQARMNPETRVLRVVRFMMEGERR